MAGSYEIVSHEAEGEEILVLRRVGGTDFLEKLSKRPKQSVRFRLIVRMVKKVQSEGREKFVGSLVRELDSGLALFELKVAGQVIRVMAYIEGSGAEQAIVLLFDFDGHQGSNQIPRHIMEKARARAKAAREALREDGDNGNR